MSPAPPPGAVVLELSGLRGPADHAAVEAAIRGQDPGAGIWTNWPRGLVAIETAMPAEALRRAVQDAGFIAGLRAAGASLADPRPLGGMILRVVGFTFAGFVLGALAGAAIGIGSMALDPVCRAGTDSGGCAMGIPAFAIGAALLGAPLGFALAFRRPRGR